MCTRSAGQRAVNAEPWLQLLHRDAVREPLPGPGRTVREPLLPRRTVCASRCFPDRPEPPPRRTSSPADYLLKCCPKFTFLQ
ncbi:hypothetical protein NDU88_007579 [Pleurodeles waltl]|uniref:Uncharacterized protein n=1 Tax=Pleurodeles waltl TaxID=8319 RepID=A0AAV7MHH4_PLEWA|nr:hypothetical protein NDU88_007579 [Pleurodeles waltl]